MHYLMLIRVPAGAWSPTPEAASPEAWVDDATRSGARLIGERLQPAEEATTVRVRGDEVLLTDGPFAEMHDLIGGFDVLRVGSREEAVAVAAAHPVTTFGAVELREVWPFGPDDDGSPAAPDAAEHARYLLLMAAEPGVPAPVDAAEGGRPDAWIDEMLRRGLDYGGARLRPAEEAITVRRDGGRLIVTDGPFAELREQVAGFNLLAAADLDEAIEAAAAHPGARLGAIEVRALWPLG